MVKEQDYYTLKQIAEMWEMNLQTIRIYVKNGELKASKVGKQYIVSKENLKEFVESKKANY